MLASAISRQGANARIRWQQADALSLPFEDDSFDAVCCQFGAMFFSDRTAGFREAHRVLKPGSRLLFNVWDRSERNDFARVVTDVAGTIFPRDPPNFLARTPHCHHEVGQIDAEVRAAGLSFVENVTIEKLSEAANACDPAAPETFTDRAAEAIAALYGEGPVSSKIQGHVILGRA